MAIVTLGIDLAKNVLALHDVDATARPALVRPSVPRGKLLELIAGVEPVHGPKAVDAMAGRVSPPGVGPPEFQFVRDAWGSVGFEVPAALQLRDFANSTHDAASDTALQ